MSRLLHVFNRYVQPGGEESAVLTIEGLLREDHEVERCFFESGDWVGPGAPGRLRQMRLSLYNAESARRFEEMTRRFRPDAAVFHNTLPVGSPALYHAAVRARVPVIHFLHNFRPFSVGGTLYWQGRFFEEALRGRYLREVCAGVWQGSRLKSAAMALVLWRLHRSGWLGGVAAWVGVSEFLREKMITAAGLPAARVHGLRHSWVARPGEPPPGDQGYYLFLGRLVEVKGVEVLLRAWERVHERLGPAGPALRIGGEGPLAGRVREAAGRNPLIQPLGHVVGAAKEAQLEGCRALLAPSVWWEPLGLVTYEAYDYGKPMLAARAGGLMETVQHGVTGWLHEPGDDAALAAQVLAMEAAPPESRHAMGRAGRAWLLRETTPARWREAFQRILEGVLHDRK